MSWSAFNLNWNCSCVGEVPTEKECISLHIDENSPQKAVGRQASRSSNNDSLESKLYSATPDQPLERVPVREGNVWYFPSLQDWRSVLSPTSIWAKEVSLSLFVNGFSFSEISSANPTCAEMQDVKEQTVCLSPFSQVIPCILGIDKLLSEFKVFRVLCPPKCQYYFGVRVDASSASDPEEALEQTEKLRRRWISDILDVVSIVAASLLPNFKITCAPVGNVLHTSKRLMAGYLIHSPTVSDSDMSSNSSIVSVQYGDLQAYHQGFAQLNIYEDASCRCLIFVIPIQKDTTILDGANPQTFRIDRHRFSTRAEAERGLWLRAMQNIKVKLRVAAPSPSEEELEVFREAIMEKAKEVEASVKADIGMLTGMPLLQRCPQALVSRIDYSGPSEIPLEHWSKADKDSPLALHIDDPPHGLSTVREDREDEEPSVFGVAA